MSEIESQEANGPYFKSKIGLKALGQLLIFLALPTLSVAEEKKFELSIYLTKKQALEIAFPGADSVDREKIWLTDEQRVAIGQITLEKIEDQRITYYAGKKADKPMGYMVIDHVIGKSFPMTFMVVLNLDGAVRNVEIMVYREPRGWEVKYKSFLSQFFGRNADSDFRDINSITGATLSVRAMTKGVRKAVAAFKVLVLEKPP
ncbi:MAG: FMN-binding protein [Nitrospinota bacterium]|nr:FMN-binding protein [Nitrospinota bacterium]